MNGLSLAGSTIVGSRTVYNQQELPSTIADAPARQSDFNPTSRHAQQASRYNRRAQSRSESYVVAPLRGVLVRADQAIPPPSDATSPAALARLAAGRAHHALARSAIIDSKLRQHRDSSLKIGLGGSGPFGPSRAAASAKGMLRGAGRSVPVRRPAAGPASREASRMGAGSSMGLVPPARSRPSSQSRARLALGGPARASASASGPVQQEAVSVGGALGTGPGRMPRPRVGAPAPGPPTGVTSAPKDATKRILGGRRPRVLDGFQLLQAAGRALPGEAVQADVSGRGLVDAVPQDLGFFSSLERLDASDNALPLSALARLPVLQELALDCNSLAGVRLPAVPLTPPGGSNPSTPSPAPRSTLPFCSLRRLSLAYNALQPRAVALLAALPQLQRLSLAGNGMRSLPSAARCRRAVDAVRGQVTDPPLVRGGGASSPGLGRVPLFPALEELDVSENPLGYQAAGQRGLDREGGREDWEWGWQLLAWMPSLRVLDLSKTKVHCTPVAWEVEAGTDIGGMEEQSAQDGKSPPSAPSPVAFPQLEWLSLAHAAVDQPQEVARLLALPSLAVLVLTDTPIAARSAEVRLEEMGRGKGYSKGKGKGKGMAVGHTSGVKTAAASDAAPRADDQWEGQGQGQELDQGLGESAGEGAVGESSEGLDDVPRDPLLLAGLQGAALRRAKGEEGAPLGGGHGGGKLGEEAEVLVVTEGEGTRSAPSRRVRPGAGVQPEGKRDGDAGPQLSEFEVAGEGGARVTATGLLPAVMRARAKGMRGVGDERAGGLTGLQWRSAGEAARRRALKGIYGAGGGGAGVPGQVGPAGSSQLEGLGVASLDEGIGAGSSLVGAGGPGDGKAGGAGDAGDEAEAEEERAAAAALEEEVRRMRAELRSSRLGRSGGGRRSGGNGGKALGAPVRRVGLASQGGGVGGAHGDEGGRGSSMLPEAEGREYRGLQGGGVRLRLRPGGGEQGAGGAGAGLGFSLGAHAIGRALAEGVRAGDSVEGGAGDWREGEGDGEGSGMVRDWTGGGALGEGEEDELGVRYGALHGGAQPVALGAVPSTLLSREAAAQMEIAGDAGRLRVAMTYLRSALRQAPVGGSKAGEEGTGGGAAAPSHQRTTAAMERRKRGRVRGRTPQGGGAGAGRLAALDRRAREDAEVERALAGGSRGHGGRDGLSGGRQFGGAGAGTGTGRGEFHGGGVPARGGGPAAQARARGRAALAALEAAVLAAGEGTEAAGQAAAVGLGREARAADELAAEAVAMHTRWD